MKKTILVADDEIGIRTSLEKILQREGYQVITAADGDEAFRLIRQQPVNLLISDIRMAGMDGMELLKVTRSVSPDTEVIIITGHASVDTAVDSMKEGAYDYITKPFKKAAILRSVRNAIEKQTLKLDNQNLKKRLAELESGPLIETSSPKMREVVELVQQMAPSQATALILGESGTGKEVIADMIHRLSPRSARPIIKVNCAAIPETLIESELFGYEKGAFTGAAGRRQGRFEVADGSTIFLDEIGEIPPSVQVKLLRILQEGTFERLGSNSTIQVNVRIVAATNRDLAKLVSEGRFREDLYWRLNVISIRLPQLKERVEDIPVLVQHFMNRFNSKNKKELQGIEAGAMDALMAYGWPGNVRELENVIERCVVLDKDGVLGLDDLPPSLKGSGSERQPSVQIPLGMPMDEIEQLLIERTLKYTKGDKALAAKLLGLSTRTLYRKLGA